MNMTPGKLKLFFLTAWLLIGLLHLGLLLLRASEAQAAEPAHQELEAAIDLFHSEGAGTALPVFETLLQEFHSAGDRPGEAQVHRYLGECHWRMGNFDSARTSLESALVLSRSLGLRRLEGRVRNVRGLLEWDLANYEAALSDFAAAYAIADELGDRRLSASTMNNRGLVRDELGEFAASLADYKAALELFQSEKDRRGQGDALGNIGGVHLLLGRFAKALDYYTRSLAISEEQQLKPAMAIDHGNIAQSLLGLGRTDEALLHYDKALALVRETGMKQEEAYWLRGKANALIGRGQYDQGLELHRAALSIYRRSGARALLLASRHDMGMLMLTLGDFASAETWFRQAASLAREIGQAQALTENLLALGDLQYRRGQPEAARALYLQGLERSTGAGEKQFQAVSWLRLARVDRSQAHYGEAARRAASALEMARQTGSVPIEAEAWFAIAEAARGQSAGDKAIRAYAQSERTAGTDGDPELLWQIHYGRALMLKQSGETEAAINALKAAVKIIESVRDRLREERYRAGWVEDKYRVYVELVRLQLQIGRTQEAFSTAERLRARTFLAQMQRGSRPDRAAGAGPGETALLERIRQLQSELARERRLPAPERRQAAVSTYSAELRRAERDYQTYLDDVGAPPAGTNLAAVLSPGQVQKQLGAGEALIEYVVGEDELVIFLLRPGGIYAWTRPQRNDELTSRVDLLRELVQQPGDGAWRKPAAALSEILLAPMGGRDNLSGVRRLIVVAHGALNYLPFALLPLEDAAGPLLVERFALSYLPAAAVLGYPVKTAENRRSMFALAPGRSRLEFAPREAASVAAMFEPDARLLLGARATESAFKEQAGGFRLLHLATHGVFNSRNPLLSGLELEPGGGAEDGLLEVHEIMRLSLAADLVTLSACQTGLGAGWFTDIPAGDDFVGLTRAFLVAGSRSVLASLWEVDDRSTVDLMEGFYWQLAAEPGAMDEADALAGIQRKLLHSKEFNHPFYWASFVLVGRRSVAADGRTKRATS